MPNVIELNLLNNKSIVATMQGYPLANENSYKIIAGEENSTKFIVKSIPNQYVNARLTVEMVNAKGYGIAETDIINNELILPVGMAVAGYGYVLIRAYIDNEIAVFQPLKIKVWNTIPQWQDFVDKTTNVRIDNGYLILTENGNEYNLGYVQGYDGETPYIGENGNWFIGDTDTGVLASGGATEEYINQQIDNAVSPIKQEIDDLYLLSNATVTGTEEVVGAYSVRQTANGLADLIDGALTKVVEIKGNTVVDETTGELKNASISAIKSTGKNLFNAETATHGKALSVENGELYNNATRFSSDYIAVLAETQYYINWETVRWACCYDANKNFIRQTPYKNNIFTTLERTAYMRITASLDELNTIMLNQGETASPFEPYKEDTWQLSETLELGQWDSFNPQTGELVKGTKTLVFDGTENWGDGSSLKTLHVFELPVADYSGKYGANGLSELICNLYMPRYSNDNGSIYITGTADFGNKIVIGDDNYATIGAWKTHLAELAVAGTPLTVSYKLKTPTTKPIENVPKYYTAWANGKETIEGNGNSVFGALPTTTNIYAVKKGV